MQVHVPYTCQEKVDVVDVVDQFHELRKVREEATRVVFHEDVEIDTVLTA